MGIIGEGAEFPPLSSPSRGKPADATPYGRP